MSDYRPPSREALATIRAWPDGEWLSEAEVAALLRGRGHPIRETRDGYRFGDRRLTGVIREAHRRSWLRCDREALPRYVRTPKGLSDTTA